MSLFRPMKNQLVGVEISGTSIKMVEVQLINELYHLSSYGIEPLEKGIIIDKLIEDSEVLGEIIASLAQRIGVSSNQVATAVPDDLAVIKLIDMEANLSDSEIDAQIRLDADQYIPYPLDNVYLDFEVLGLSPINNNMVQILLVACENETVEQRVDAFIFADFQTKVVDIESYAIERAFNLNLDRLPAYPQSVALVDIGHTHTTLYVVIDGEIVYHRKQLFGGAQLTQAIQNKYELSYEEATFHKREQTLPVSYQTEVLKPFIETLTRHILRSLQFYYSSSEQTKVDHIVLSGGSATLPSMATMVQYKSGNPVSIANPFSAMTIDSSINKDELALDAPGLMVACGLALRSFD